MKEKVMNGLEKFSKAMLSPLSYISAAGLILVLGALLTSTSLSAMIPVLQWTPIKLLGQLIYNCIMVIINNLSLMFCVGIAAALAKKNKQQAAIIGLMSYFMYLTAGNVTLTQLGMLAEADPMVGLYGTGQSTVFGIQTVDMGVFGGILLGLVCGWVYNRTCEKQFKGIITQIYSGNRWSFTASLASITEPLDFMFCFSAPILWVAHACISGLFIVLLHIFHVTGFTTNLLGSVLMNLSAGADKTNYPTLYLLALCQIAVYFVVFTLLIKAFNLHTPGREEVSTETAKSDAPAKKASVKNAAEVQCVIDGLGGKENILSVDNCFTRLRVNIKDPAKLDEASINKLPNSGIVKKGTDIQIVYGLQVADIKRAVEAQLENQ